MVDFSASLDFLPSSGCIRIHTMNYTLHSVLKNLWLLGSNMTNTCDDIIPSFNYLSIVVNFNILIIVGIRFQK